MQQIKIVPKTLDKKFTNKLQEEANEMLKDNYPIHAIVDYIHEKYGCVSYTEYGKDITYINIF